MRKLKGLQETQFAWRNLNVVDIACFKRLRAASGLPHIVLGARARGMRQSIEFTKSLDRSARYYFSYPSTDLDSTAVGYKFEVDIDHEMRELLKLPENRDLLRNFDKYEQHVVKEILGEERGNLFTT